MKDRLWLERDDDIARLTREGWKYRARTYQQQRLARGAARLLAASLEAGPEIDQEFAALVARIVVEARTGKFNSDRLAAQRDQSFEDAADRPWLKAKPLFLIEALSDDVAAAFLVASLTVHPPDLSKRRRET